MFRDIIPYAATVHAPKPTVYQQYTRAIFRLMLDMSTMVKFKIPFANFFTVLRFINTTMCPREDQVQGVT